MNRLRSHTGILRLFTAILSLSVLFSLASIQLGDWLADSCADDCDESCEEFCGCTHCLTPPPAISISIPVPEFEDGLTSSAGLAPHSRFDQAWVSAIDHPPQLSL